MACLLARRHLPPGERASAYGVVVHLEERQPEVSVSPHEDRVSEFKKEPDGELTSKKFQAQKLNSPPLSKLTAKPVDKVDFHGWQWTFDCLLERMEDIGCHHSHFFAVRWTHKNSVKSFSHAQNQDVK